MEPKVSIIVPIYRVEKYLSQCVDSLLCQTLEEIEIILVDDGSPDNCGRIADEYARQDSRVKVIHQENAGLSAARNTGIRAATGEYIGFVDSDDWAGPEMFRRLYDAAVRCNADIVASGHCDLSNGKVLVSKPHPLAGRTLSDHAEIMEVRKNLYGHGFNDPRVEAFPMAVWISLYQKDLIDRHSLSFENVLSEDTIFNLDAYRHARILTFTGDTDYCYRKEGQTSVTQTFSDEKQIKYAEFLTRLAQKAEQEEDPECIMRSKRMAIDYCRLYVDLVDKSGMRFGDKKQFVRRFAEDKSISRWWSGYPLKALPIQQRVFHKAFVSGYYGATLVMNSLRQKVKSKG